MRSFSEVPELDKQIADRFPREIRHNELALTLAPMVPSDWQMLLEFLRDTPNEDRQFFRHDLSDAARVEGWCKQLDYRHTLPILAWSGDRIAADAVLEREPGLWTSHVGRVRLLVHPEFRGKGIGKLMLGELKEIAKQLNLHKLVCECAAEQTGLIAALRRMGFDEAARLPEHIRDQRGQTHDMVLMTTKLS